MATTSTSHTQIEHPPQVEEVAPTHPPPSFPSRPASVTSQYTSFNDPASQSHHEDKDLDEIFPQAEQEEPDGPFDNQYVSKIHQEELDSVFRPEAVRSDPHSQLSRPGSVSSHHTEPLPNADSILPVHYRPSVSGDSVVASPQSVCSNQFTHQSRPPSVNSQHGSYHDPNSMSVPPYLASQSYSIPPPEMVFTQPMNCTSNINIQPMTNVYDKPVSTVAAPDQAMHFIGDASAVNNHLIGSASSYNVQLQQQSCFAHQYGTTPHYTSTSLTQECVTIQSNTRCVTPQNYSSQQSSDGQPVDVFVNLAVPTDTLLLPSTGSSDVIPELHTPNKNFPVEDFSNILSYSSPN